MKITLICVGKVKESFYRDTINKYSKVLKKLCAFNIIEVPDEKTLDNASLREEELVKISEGESILKHIDDNMFLITLEILGEKLSSEELSSKFRVMNLMGYENIGIVIGGSLGLSKKVSQRSNFKLSFSNMTFPHQLMRVIILEQLITVLSTYDKADLY